MPRVVISDDALKIYPKKNLCFQKCEHSLKWRCAWNFNRVIGAMGGLTRSDFHFDPMFDLKKLKFKVTISIDSFACLSENVIQKAYSDQECMRYQ